MATETKTRLQDVIEKGVLEGKSDSEIAKLVVSEKAAPDLEVNEIVDAILTVRKMQDVQKALNEQKKLDEEKAEAKKTSNDTKQIVKELVNEELKSITVGPNFSKFGIDKELKRFNPRTGKREVVEMKVSEAYGTFNNLFKAFFDRDFKSAQSISLEIDQDNNRKDLNLLGKATPTVSDVTTRGGFGVPTEVSDMIMQVIYEISAVYDRLNKDNIIFESKVYPLMYGINVGYIADQSTGVTEKNPTFTNPSISMYRVGGYSTISNRFLAQKGSDLVNAFVQAYGSAFAEFLDLHCCAGNVTGNSDKVDGIIFDPLTYLPSAVALSSLTPSVLKDIKNALSAKCNPKNLVWIANRKVADAIGLLENTGGMYAFPGYTEGRSIAPFGIPLITNPQIPSTLNVSGDNRTSGTSDALVCVDLSKVLVGVSGDTRIDMSEHIFFTDDLMAIRAIKNFGQKVLSGTSTGGIVSVAQELTN